MKDLTPYPLLASNVFFVQRINFRGKGKVPVGKPTGLVCGQFYVDPVIDIAPFGVVIGVLCHLRHRGHKIKGLNKIAEQELADYPVITSLPMRTSDHALFNFGFS